MIHSTKGIVLRTVKYGETSVIASIFTEAFGIQSYIINGVRTQSKTSKAHFFQSSSILEMQVYHNDLKNLQRIKELKWAHLYRSILSDIIKNAVALYMVELLQKCLKQPEATPELFSFCEDAFLALDTCTNEIAANFPLYFSMQLAYFLGFQLNNNYSSEKNIFNLGEGNFSNKSVPQDYPVSTEISSHVSEILKAQHPSELNEIKLNKNIRKSILSVMENYYAIHISDFGVMKTLPVLHEMF
ncbi:MAG: DNA repair protein RecO [Ginsengibacter sp.]